MPSYNQTPYPFSKDADRDVRADQTTDVDGNSTPRSQEQLSRLAELVASGELPLPSDLSADELDELVRNVRVRRRRRLFRYIARAIALDIHRSREYSEKGTRDVTKKL